MFYGRKIIPSLGRMFFSTRCPGMAALTALTVDPIFAFFDNI